MSAIKVKNLHKSYGRFEALRGISFTVEKGEIVGFLGPNGAGKTTTMKILTCFLSPTSGEVAVAGIDALKESLAVRHKIGYLPENNPLYLDMTVGEYLSFVAEIHDVLPALLSERVRHVVQECGLTEMISMTVGALSKGYRQRVGLAAALVHDPEILILDEPTVGLDPNQIVEIRSLIKRLGREKTVLLSSHLLTEVELTCNRVVIIDRGQIVASGTPAELRGLVENHANVRLTVRGHQDAIFGLLKAIPGVREVTCRSVREKGACGFDIVTVRNRDPRPAIVQALIEKELQLLEIYREAVTLEEVFNQVTRVPL